MTNYDILIIGHVSKDIIITPESEETLTGGAIVHAAITTKRIGANILALTKIKKEDINLLEVFKTQEVPIKYLSSKETTSIKNTYFSADRERRECLAISQADPFLIADIPADITANLYYLGGLMSGEFPIEFIKELKKRGKLAIDAQSLLRVNRNGEMKFEDFEMKKEILPLFHFLKTDHAEAEILTGLKDPIDAGKKLRSWGINEVVITHNKGVSCFYEDKTDLFPFTASNLSGRTGRGDTCFSTYCYKRQTHSPKDSCLFASALTSLKMETPGPFSLDISDVEKRIKERY